MRSTKTFTSSVFLCLCFIWNAPVFSQESDEQTPEEVIEVPQVIEITTQLDYIPEYTEEEVKERLKKIESSIKLTYNDKVAAFIHYFAVRNRDYTRLMIQRKNLYFPMFEKVLAKHKLPDELKYLAVVESGLNPKAGSRVGAIGLWQFMPRTGKSYGLDYDPFIDEKMDPYKSTVAASKYLTELYRMFNDWELALASYNCGPGNLRRAIRRSGYKDGFWSIYNKLPRETRAYVPQFIALMYVMNYAQEHNLDHPNLDYPMETDTILVNNYMDLEVFSNLSDICLEDIQKLNPELKRNAIPEHVKNYILKIPVDKKEYFVENRVAIFDSASKTNAPTTLLASLDEEENTSTVVKKKVYHTVRSGESLGKIAEKHHVSISELRRWNKINGSLIRSGQRLVLYKNYKVSSSTSNSSSIAQKTVPKTKSSSTKYYIVQPGDTLWRISQQYEGLTIEQIKKLNNLKTNNIKPGMKLVIS